MKILGVVGIAQSEEDGTPVILVFVNKMDERIRRDVPSTLEGYPVRVHEAGDVRPTR